jgi:DNA-binding transcriptional LysR family regulator
MDLNLMPSDSSLLDLDLATLETMAQVYRLGSFTAAADKLGVTQPTVSYSINRLRKVTGDPLFIRLGGKTTATERCRKLIPAVRRILADAGALTEPEKFDPT